MPGPAEFEGDFDVYGGARRGFIGLGTVHFKIAQGKLGQVIVVGIVEELVGVLVFLLVVLFAVLWGGVEGTGWGDDFETVIALQIQLSHMLLSVADVRLEERLRMREAADRA